MQRSFKQISFFILVLSIFALSCKEEQQKPDYRAEMRKFVEKISATGRAWRPGFIVVPQNGLALLTSDGTPQGNPQTAYIAAIDGVGQEELWYGYDNNDDVATPDDVHNELIGQCAFARDHGLKVLVTDYAVSFEKAENSYSKNFASGFISFAADHRDLDNIPDYPVHPFRSYVNGQQAQNLSEAKNFLYLISPSYYNTKDDFIHAVGFYNYDVVIIDLDFDAQNRIDTADINYLHSRHPHQKILCYMSIGEAESYRWYWKPYWNVTPPEFLVAEDPSWLDNFSVRYWDPNWQSIICGQNDSYLRRIVDAGFDGVYLDLVSQYEYFEE